jgi:putative endonuclease
MVMTDTYHVYILRCGDGSYYVGTTLDLEQRLHSHNEGRAAMYTALRRPLELVYSEKHESIEAARARERQIKRWSRSKKEALIAGNRQDLKRLSKRGHRVARE